MNILATMNLCSNSTITTNTPAGSVLIQNNPHDYGDGTYTDLGVNKHDHATGRSLQGSPSRTQFAPAAAAAHRLAPYHTLPAFDEGIDDYMSGRSGNPYTDPRDGVKAQAHDRGLEYAMRVVRWTDQQYLPDFAK
jgi:hypothetical protein